MKKWSVLASVSLCFVLALVLIFAMPTEANAASESDLTFTLNDDGQSYSVTDCSDSASGELVIPSIYNDKPVTGIGDLAFDWCDILTSVTIPDGVTSIGEEAFYYCSNLTSVTIPNSVTSIGEKAFCCSKLTSVTIPDSVTSIGKEAFISCISLVSVTIGKGTTSIGENAFIACHSLNGIWVNENNPNYCNDDQGVLFSKDKTTLIRVPGGISGTYTIPDSVTTIAENAFYGCYILTSVTIPDSVISIGDSAFTYCERLASVTIPNSVTSIGEYVFMRCAGLTSMIIPDSVTSIGDFAFTDCDNMSSITIPDSVTNIGDGAFYGCGIFKTVYYSGTETQWNQISVGANNRNLLSAESIYYNVKIAKITKQPVSVVAASGDTAKVTVSATGDGLTYQWYFKSASASKFSLTTAFTGTSYSISMSSARNGRQVYCVITDKYGNSVTTDIVTLTMGNPVKITKQPVSVAVAEGKTATVKIVAQGDGLVYRWYYKDAGSKDYTYTSSYKSNTYSVKMTDARNGRRVLCRVYDKYGNVVRSESATLSMQAPLKITKQPVSVTVKSGKTAKVTVSATGDGLTYKWYYKNAGASKFTLTTAFKSNSYSVEMNSSRNGRQVYCVITDKYGNTVTTDVVTLTMGNPVKITKQPVSVTVASGKTAKVTVSATGDGLTYKWYYKNAGASKFTLTTAFTGSSYSIKMSSSRNGRQVYCVITDKYGNTVTTNTVTLKKK